MSVHLGVGVFIAGLVIVALALMALRLMARSNPVPADELLSPVSPISNGSKESVIVLQPGGRVEYISALARAHFNLREDESPDLELLARHARPTEDFIDLCAAPGVKRLTVGGKPVEAASYEIPGVYPRMLISVRGKDSASAMGNGNEGSDEILRVATDRKSVV